MPLEAPEGDQERVLELARKRFAIVLDAESESRAKELDDLKFLAASPDDHWQWPEDIYRSRTTPGEGGIRPCLTINKLPQHHRQVTNEQRMNRPQIRVQPVDDKGDPEVADILNGILRHIQVSSEADLAFDIACDAQVACGVGYFRILTEYSDERSFDQDILIAPVRDRFKVYLDPHIQHPAGKDAKWGFIIEDLPKEEYESLYGEEDPIDWAQAAIGDQSQWFPGNETVRIAEYFALETVEKTLCLYENGETLIKDSPEAGRYAARRPVRERKTRITRCKWYKMTGQAVLRATELPTRYIPIVRVVGNEWVVEGKSVVSGIVRNAKDAQRTYNYNASLEVELNALAPKAPFIGYPEQFEGHEEQWKKANVVPFAFLKANLIVDETTGQIVPVPLPQRAQPAMPQMAVITAKLAAGDDIKSTTGQYDPSLGNNPQAKSGVALAREQAKSDVGTFHYIDNGARAQRYAGTIILDMLARVYGTKQVARIVGEDGTVDQVRLDPSLPGAYEEVKDQSTGRPIGKIYNLGVGKYDVVVSTGPSFTTKRQEAAEFLTKVIQSVQDPATAQVLTYLALKTNDWAGADEATEMLGKLMPAGLVKDKQNEDDEAEPMVQTPQGPLPVSQAARLIVALIEKTQQQVEAAKLGDDGAKALDEAQRLLTEVHAKTDALKMREQMMGKTFEAEAAKDEVERIRIVSDMKLMVNGAIAKLEASKQIAPTEPERASEAEAIEERNAAISIEQAGLSAALTQALAALSAPRRVDLVRDAHGRAMGAVSTLVS